MTFLNIQNSHNPESQTLENKKSLTNVKLLFVE
jgi:hypothetical protein